MRVTEKVKTRVMENREKFIKALKGDAYRQGKNMEHCVAELDNKQIFDPLGVMYMEILKKEGHLDLKRNFECVKNIDMMRFYKIYNYYLINKKMRIELLFMNDKLNYSFFAIGDNLVTRGFLKDIDYPLLQEFKESNWFKESKEWCGI